MSHPTCAVHTAFVYERGGETIVGEITEMSICRWGRIRDDISSAFIRIPLGQCCELMSEVFTVKHELHIFRDGEMVWCGPITRLEFMWDGVEVFAEDMLWVAKRRALSVGYNYQYPPSGAGPIGALDLVDYLLDNQTYGRFGDPWNMLAHLNHVVGPDDPLAGRAANSWSVSTWEELDALAEDYGIDYTVVGRDIFYFDVHLAWVELDDLVDGHLSEWPRIVEYGNAFASRYIHTDGSGYAGLADAPDPVLAEYGEEIDFIATRTDQADRPVDTVTGEPEVPSDDELAAWAETASHNMDMYYPPRQSIVVPANATLMPSSPWVVNTLVPGSWFVVTVDRECRAVDEYHRLHQLAVEEIGGQAETVKITTATAPATRLEPEV